MSGRERLSDTATEAWWGFLDEPEVIAGLTRVCRRAVGTTGMDADDLHQDLCLWISVREQGKTYDLTSERGVQLFLYWAAEKARTLAVRATGDDWRLEELPTYGGD